MIIFTVEITGDDSATMQYARYEEDIVHAHGIELVGWTFDKIVNPSQLSSSLGPLKELRNALKDGSCKFVRLEPEDVKKRIAAHRAKIQPRKIRKDKGTTRRRRKSAGLIQDDEHGDGGPDGRDDADDADEPIAKRRRTMGGNEVSEDINSESENDG